MIQIDGGRGEGGGQILRTSLALSCVLAQPFEIINIRAGREKPGLRPQHLSSLNAARRISNAEIEGNKIGSTSVSFKPDKVIPGTYVLEVGTAGSTLLVLHTVYLPLALAEDESRVKVEGGTHVSWSPPFEHAGSVWRPLLSGSGIDLKLSLLAAGYYPKGGGRIDVKIKGRSKIEPLRLIERGELKTMRITGAVSNLDEKIAIRLIRSVRHRARESGMPAKIIKEEIARPPCENQGAYVFIELDYENVCAGFVGLGEKGKRAEIVADEVWKEAHNFISGAGAVEPHLADQLLLPLSLASGESEFTTTSVTSHLLTNAWAIESFNAAKIIIEGSEGTPGHVIVRPDSARLSNIAPN